MIDQSHIFFAVLAGLFHVLGVLTAINSLLNTRTSQSAVAWAISCITFPYIAVPSYWLLGRNRFGEYVAALRASNSELKPIINGFRKEKIPLPVGDDKKNTSRQFFEQLADMPFTSRNKIELMIDGEDFFKTVFEHIATAENYILLQFFIVRDDQLGWNLRDALAKKVKQGVKVYFMYDEIGSHGLSKKFIASLSRSGINIEPFKAGWTNRFQLNFRNHRKIVVIDGNWAATGGANLGREYCGQSERFGYWRDTMIGITGGATGQIQLAFAQDWLFVSGQVPELNWSPAIQENSDNQSAVVIPTGPADKLHKCSMMFTHAINSARQRLWITTPYFVPDNEIICALQLAALRGVDVRILLPHNPDHLLVYWASFTYLEELEQAGVKFFRYTRGLLHEKVVLVDDELVLIGSANLDNRSFYLNFEITAIVENKQFASQTESMLRQDFSYGKKAGSNDFKNKGKLFQVKARIARLFSPVL